MADNNQSDYSQLGNLSGLQNINPQALAGLAGLQGLPNYAGIGYGMGGPATIASDPTSGGGGGGKGKGKTPGGSSSGTTGDPQQPQQQADALTMGLGMFFQQYLAPMIQAQSQANMGLIGNWGNAMQQALKNPLPPGVAQTIGANVPQEQMLMGMLNQAQMQQAGAPYQTLISQIGGQSSAMQALMDAFTKAATYQELGAGSPVQLGNLLSGILGGSNTLAGGLAQLLGGSSNIATGLTPSNSAISAALAQQNAASGYTNPNQPSR